MALFTLAQATTYMAANYAGNTAWSSADTATKTAYLERVNDRLESLPFKDDITPDFEMDGKLEGVFFLCLDYFSTNKAFMRVVGSESIGALSQSFYWIHETVADLPYEAQAMLVGGGYLDLPTDPDIPQPQPEVIIINGKAYQRAVGSTEWTEAFANESPTTRTILGKLYEYNKGTGEWDLKADANISEAESPIYQAASLRPTNLCAKPTSSSTSGREFVGAEIDGPELRLTRDNGAVIILTLPAGGPGGTPQSTNDFVDAAINANLITLTRRNGDVVTLTLPAAPALPTNFYTNADIVNSEGTSTLVLTRADGQQTTLTLPSGGGGGGGAESTNDFVSAELTGNNIILTRRSGTTVQLDLSTTDAIEQLVEETDTNTEAIAALRNSINLAVSDAVREFHAALRATSTTADGHMIAPFYAGAYGAVSGSPTLGGSTGFDTPPVVSFDSGEVKVAGLADNIAKVISGTIGSANVGPLVEMDNVVAGLSGTRNILFQNNANGNYQVRESASGLTAEFTDANANAIPVQVGDRWRLSASPRGANGVEWILSVTRAGATQAISPNSVFFLTNDITNIDGAAALAALSMSSLYFNGLNSKWVVLEHTGDYESHGELASEDADDNYLGRRTADVITPRTALAEEFQFTDKVFDRNGQEILGGSSGGSVAVGAEVVLDAYTGTLARNTISALTNAIDLTQQWDELNIVGKTSVNDGTAGNVDGAIAPSISMSKVKRDWKAVSGLGGNRTHQVQVAIDISENDGDLTATDVQFGITLQGTANSITHVLFVSSQAASQITDIEVVRIARAGGGDGTQVDGIADVPGLQTALDLKANKADLADVAETGSYNDLTDKPTIPTGGGGTSRPVTDYRWNPCESISSANQRVVAELVASSGTEAVYEAAVTDGAEADQHEPRMLFRRAIAHGTGAASIDLEDDDVDFTNIYARARIGGTQTNHEDIALHFGSDAIPTRFAGRADGGGIQFHWSRTEGTWRLFYNATGGSKNTGGTGQIATGTLLGTADDIVELEVDHRSITLWVNGEMIACSLQTADIVSPGNHFGAVVNLFQHPTTGGVYLYNLDIGQPGAYFGEDGAAAESNAGGATTFDELSDTPSLKDNADKWLKVNSDGDAVEAVDAPSGGTPDDNSVGETQLKDLAVTTGKLAPGAVTASKIGANQVTNTHIGTGAVTNTKIGTGAVTNTKIGANAVTEDKLTEAVRTKLNAAGGLPTGYAAHAEDTVELTIGSTPSSGFGIPAAFLNLTANQRLPYRFLLEITEGINKNWIIGPTMGEVQAIGAALANTNDIEFGFRVPNAGVSGVELNFGKKEAGTSFRGQWFPESSTVSSGGSLTHLLLYRPAGIYYDG